MKFLSESGVPEYAAIIFFVTGLLIAVNYPWVKNLYSSTKFRSLQTDIQDVMTTVAKDVTDHTDTVGLNSDISTLDFKLEKLRIGLKIGQIDSKGRQWLKLEQLLTYSRLGLIREARKVFKDEGR